MKKLCFLVSVAVLGLLCSCGAGKGTNPRAVADGFMKAFLVETDLDRARLYVADELRDELPESDKMNDLERFFIGIIRDHSTAHGYRFEYVAEESEIAADFAIIRYVITAKANPEFRGTAEIELEKGADGKWLIVDYDVERDDEAIDFGF